jgi:prepilin-type N-terminal cleavage/methylation domain-containing protein
MTLLQRQYKQLSTKGFTLIELLVVISIIALLAVGSVGIYPKIMLNMKSGAAMSKQAAQIYTGLVAYAATHEQSFPSEVPGGGQPNTSNDVLRTLFAQDIVDDEKVFFVNGSAWHGTLKGPDQDIGTPTDNYSRALDAKENHWAYVNNLTQDRSPSIVPILMDGGVQGGPGRWTDNVDEPGGCWKGKKAIVIRVGGSAKVHDLDGTFTVKEKRGGNEMDIFSQDFGTKQENLLNPNGG